MRKDILMIYSSTILEISMFLLCVLLGYGCLIWGTIL
jgi:hypothetical protein